jgi:DNA-binding response OmpR family regulator
MASSLPPSASLRALVAEDDPEMRASVADALQLRGFDVTAVASGDELIERLAGDDPPALLVTDVAMPWMSGIQVALAARSAGLTFPILVMTALRDERIEGQVAALGSGAALLRKPFDLAELDAAIDARLRWTHDGR